MKSLSLLLVLFLSVHFQIALAADPVTLVKLPADLLTVPDAAFASLDKLAAGSKEAQDAQWAAVAKLGLPLEVKSAKGGIVFRLIPPGTFTMGSPDSEKDAAIASLPAEMPGWLKPQILTKLKEAEVQHQVTLSKPFYCGKYPVTQGQWEAVMGNNPSDFKNAGKEAPVEQVSWNDCQEFLTKLCALEGVPAGTYRLLTEAEWEYACRGGTETATYGELGSIAWYDLNSGKTTHPVGQKTPNGYGLYDMIGNVWQHCGDWYEAYASAAVTDPTGPGSGDLKFDAPHGVSSVTVESGKGRVIRGSGFDNPPIICRAANRLPRKPDDTFRDKGFRVLRLAPDQLAMSALPAPAAAPLVQPLLPAVPTPVSAAGLPADLTPVAAAEYAPLDKLAAGSKEAQDAQRTTVEKQSLPLEVKSAKTGIVFRLIPPGTFTMGSPKSEQDAMVAAGGAKPEWVAVEVQHQVTLTKAFYCSKYPVTQGQWGAVMKSNPSYFKNAGKDAPVELVDWDECQKFLNKLCALEGVPPGTYRLLTEAEWEYACRAGTTTALYNGDLVIKGQGNAPVLDPIAWYGGNSEVTYEGGYDSSKWPEKQYDHQRAGTHPVGQRVPNAYGLYDTIGNVWQWCGDFAAAYPAGMVTDPTGAASGSYRVRRGGSWSNGARDCRAASRGGNKPGDRDPSLGFRVLRLSPGP